MTVWLCVLPGVVIVFLTVLLGCCECACSHYKDHDSECVCCWDSDCDHVHSWGAVMVALQCVHSQDNVMVSAGRSGLPEEGD